MAANQKTYRGNGVQFRYPADWEVSEQREEEQLSITVASAQTTFWTLTLFPGRPDPADIVEAVLDAFREEYDQLDDYPATAHVCRRPTVARDIDFVCLELINTARVRAFRTAEMTVMLLYQGTDAEFERTGAVCEQMTKSLTLVGTSQRDDDDT
jgi:hypothetical protein